MDQEGKDSWLHRQAGASPVVICTKSRLAIFLETSAEMSLEMIQERFISGVDLILVEGYRSLPLPKVEVTGKGKKSELAEQADPNLLAVISPDQVDCPVPLFLAHQVKELADFLYERVLPAD
jgi:molybdopterin-guanine dinucleotide biosynthesis protein B